MAKKPGIELVALTKRYGGTVAVDAIDLKIPAGSYCCLLRPSGCGKTTTLRMIAGHEEASDGDVILGSENITHLPPAARGTKTATEDTYHSMALSRGASALGIALALGEIEAAPERVVCKDWSLYSSVASTSAGVELLRNEVVVLGNAAGWAGDLAIGHDVIGDTMLYVSGGAEHQGPVGGGPVAIIGRV